MDQLGESNSPVVLVNVFTVDPSEADNVLVTRDAAFMKRQQGFIWAQLHRGIGNSTTFMNYAVWESVAAFKTAFENPEFRRHITPSAVSRPYLSRKVSGLKSAFPVEPRRAS